MDYNNNNKYDVFHSLLVENAKFAGKYDFPLLKGTSSIATQAIPFDKVSKTTNKNQWVHFYIDDYRFERLWTNPNKYLNVLKKFKGVIATDFSVYTKMPLAMQIWNTYRNRAISFWLQDNGVDVIPNVVWGLENTYDFCFDGIPKGGTVAISTNGCIKDKTSRYYFKKGLGKMIEVVSPKTIVVYSYMPNDIFQEYKSRYANIDFLNIPNFHYTMRKRDDV